MNSLLPAVTIYLPVTITLAVYTLPPSVTTVAPLEYNLLITHQSQPSQSQEGEGGTPPSFVVTNGR